MHGTGHGRAASRAAIRECPGAVGRPADPTPIMIGRHFPIPQGRPPNRWVAAYVTAAATGILTVVATTGLTTKSPRTPDPGRPVARAGLQSLATRCHVARKCQPCNEFG